MTHSYVKTQIEVAHDPFIRENTDTLSQSVWDLVWQCGCGAATRSVFKIQLYSHVI